MAPPWGYTPVATLSSALRFWTAIPTPPLSPRTTYPSQSTVSMPSMRQNRSCLICASDFVRTSAVISLDPISLRSNDLSAIHSLMKWYRTSICFVALWLTGFLARRSAARLSIYSGIGPNTSSFNSDSSLRSQMSSLDASAATMYSA